jgi:hypothetical protein
MSAVGVGVLYQSQLIQQETSDHVEETVLTAQRQTLQMKTRNIDY